MFLVPSVLIFPIWTEINFIQTSRIVNFTKAIGNQCFIFHNMFFHPDSAYAVRKLCTIIAGDNENNKKYAKKCFLFE